MANTLVPELSVRDCARSLRLYRDVLGFVVLWERREEGFACLERDGAKIMLDQIGLGRDFDGGHDLAAPLGRGVNLQIRVQDVDGLEAAARTAGLRMVLPMEERWYLVGGQESGNRQFVVADPDGYLLRFFQDMGMRPISKAAGL